jgi:hypothetical protein
LKVRLDEIRNKKPYPALTKTGKPNHHLVDPLFRWHGKNERVLASASLNQVDILESDQSVRKVLNGGCHNYAGFYGGRGQKYWEYRHL